MPEEFDPENLEEVASETPIEKPFAKQGGAAILPKASNKAAVPNLPEEGVKKAARLGTAELTGGLSEAARKIPGVGKLLDAATDKLAKYFMKNFWKSLLLANWPTLATIAVVLILLLAILVPSFAGMANAKKCRYGKCEGNTASAFNSSDINGINGILGAGFNLKGDAKDWYFSQQDSRWGGYRPSDFAHNLHDTGCVVTSFAMIAKYYGVATNPQKMLEDSKCGGKNRDCMKKWIITAINSTGKTMSWKGIDPSDTKGIQAQLNKGNPILIYAEHLDGSSQTHAGVMIGFDASSSRMVVNDPIFGSKHVGSYNPGSVQFLAVIDGQ